MPFGKTSFPAVFAAMHAEMFALHVPARSVFLIIRHPVLRTKQLRILLKKSCFILFAPFPLHLLNRKFIKDIDTFYGTYQAGEMVGGRSPLVDYAVDDPEVNTVREGEENHV